MASSIDRLKGEITTRGGLARPNNFMVELPSFGGVSTDTMNILCRNVTLPGKQVLTHDRLIQMEKEKVAYGYAVDDVSMTFLMLNDYSIRKYFDSWVNFIIDEDTQRAAYKDEYRRRIVVHQLANGVPQISLGANINVGPFSASKSFSRGFPLGGKLDVTRSVYSIELQDAFPTSIGEITLNNDQDGFIEMTVQISYTKWKPVPAGQVQLSYDLPIGGLNFGRALT